VKTQLLIAAAGSGVRLGLDQPKALVPLDGKPLLALTLERFAALGLNARAVIAVPAPQLALFASALREAWPNGDLKIIPGGERRQDSVWNGLSALDPDTDIVVIHDAARPFVAPESIQDSIDAATAYGAATVAIPSVDTILVGDEDGFLVSTPDRARLWACQTPQTFRVGVIREAHRQAQAQGFTATDDASLVRHAGGRVKLVLGTPLNFKITTPFDLAVARLVLEEGLT
jgi:2-C-methyl-D-erythritol 4-phosphate cytidylyltransferase